MFDESPTPYPAVNEVLNLLLSEAREVLGEQFAGMYLYGSLSSGGFDPRSSDIDFLIVTVDNLDQKTIEDLEKMHQRIWDTDLKWASKLEGSYLPLEHLPRYEKSSWKYPTVNGGKFYLGPHGSDWIIQRHIIREQGFTLAGPEPKSLIDPVSPEDIRQAVIGALEGWWFPMLEEPHWLEKRGKEYHAYTILSMCRSLHALEHGTIASKQEATSWGKEELDGRRREVIDRARAVLTGDGEFDLFDQAIEFIRFTKERVMAGEQ